MDKKGSAFDFIIITFIIFVVCLIVVIGYFVGGQLSQSMHDVLDAHSTESMNYTTVLNESVDEVYSSFGVFKWLTMILIAGYMIALWLSCWKVNTHPIFFIVYFVVTIVSILLSIPLSNAWQTIAANSTLSASFTEFIFVGYVMSYLPIWITVTGFVGLIILFVRFKTGGSEIEQSL